MCMTSTSTSTANNLPKEAKPFELGTGGNTNSVLGQGQNFLNQFISQGGDQNAMGTAGNNQIMGTLAGQYMNPSTNPYLQQTANTIQANSLNSLENQLGAANQNAQGSGMLLSSANNAQKNAMARAGSRDVTNQLANLFGQNYSTERQNQLAAIPQAINAGLLPYNQALQIANLMHGMAAQNAGSQTGALGNLL